MFHAKPLQLEILLLSLIACVKGNTPVSFIAQDIIKKRVFTYNSVQFECARPTDTQLLKIVEIVRNLEDPEV